MKDKASESGGQFPICLAGSSLGPVAPVPWPSTWARAPLLRPGLAKPELSGGKSAFGLTLPAGAAPASQQFLVSYDGLGRPNVQGARLLRDRLFEGSSG